MYMVMKFDFATYIWLYGWFWNKHRQMGEFATNQKCFMVSLDNL